MLHKLILVISLIGLAVGASLAPAVASPRQQVDSYPVINSANVDNLAQIDVWGEGVYSSVAWSADESSIYVGQSTGVYRLPANDLNAEPELVFESAIAQWGFRSSQNEIMLSKGEDVYTTWNPTDGQIIATIDWDRDTYFSSDGLHIAVITFNSIQILDSQTGEMISEFSLPEDFKASQTDVVFSNDSATFYATWDVHLLAIDIATAEVLASYTLSNPWMGMTSSPDGMLLAINGGRGDDANVYLLDSKTLEEISIWETSLAKTPDYPYQIFSPDGKYLVSNAGIWDVEQEVFVYTKPIGALQFSPDGSLVIRHNSKIYDFADFLNSPTEEPEPKFSLSDNILSVAFKSDSTEFVGIQSLGNGQRTPVIIDAATGEIVQARATTSIGYADLAFSTDGSRIVITTEYVGVGGTVWVRDVATAEVIYEIPDIHAKIIVPNENGQFALIGFNDIYLLDVDTGEILSIEANHEGLIKTGDFSADGSLLATGDWAGQIIVWDMNSLEMQQAFKLEGRVSHLAFTPDNSTLIALVDGGLPTFFDLATGEAIEMGDFSLGDGLKGFMLTADGTKLIRMEGEVFVWDLTNLEPQLVIEESNDAYLGYTDQITYTHDQSLLIGSISRGVRFWNIAKAERVLSDYHHTSPMSSFALSPDGTLIATASTDGTVRFMAIVE